MDYIEITEKIRVQTHKMVKKSRYEHSVRVAEMCSQLCSLFGLNPEIGYLVGIGHDMCKDLSEKEMKFWAEKDGLGISEFEERKVSLLHGRASAMMIKEQFGIVDKDIIEAISFHTSGKLDMCDLTKCLLIADKIEPGRPQSTDEYRERLLSLPLNEMTYMVLKENHDYVSKKGYEIYPGTMDIINQSKKLCGK